MEDKKICHVTNRSSGLVCYQIPERHILRDLHPNKTVEIEAQELKELINLPGGKRLLKDYTYIAEPDVVHMLFDEKPEPEYYLTIDNIGSWITTCSLDEFKDALDFAPEGVKELIKQFAVSLPLNDLEKCKAIQEQLKFDVLSAIKNERDTKADDAPVETNTNEKQRRAAPPQETKVRRVVNREV